MVILLVIKLKKRYRRLRIRKWKECVLDWLSFKGKKYDDEDKFILAMTKIRLRKDELKVT